MTDILVEAILFDLDGTLAYAVPGGVLPAPGAIGVLDGLPTNRWAVVTRSSRRGAADALREAGLPQPRVIVGGDDVRRQKPDPEGYLRAARSLGADPHRCLVVEDSPGGMAAGHAAGALVLGLGPPGLSPHAQWWVDDLSDVSVEVDRSGVRVGIPDPAQ